MFPFYFHLTSAKNWPSIKKNGLIPHINRQTKHGKKVSWLIANVDQSDDIRLLKGFSEKNPLYVPIIIKVDASKVMLYRFGKTKSYYTPDIIKRHQILSYEYLQGKSV